MQSHVVVKMGKLGPLVRSILEKEPETRDNDRLLVLKVWAFQNNDLRKHGFSFKDFAQGFLDKVYTDPDSITRTSRKLQSENPSLRGELWESRQAYANRTRKEI